MQRDAFLRQAYLAFQVHPIVALLGPRQSGKTTLSHLFRKKYKKKFQFHYFDLENPLDLAKLASPLLTLQELKGIIVIDEVQRQPELFPVLRVLVDQNPKRKFLILGSASRELLRQSSESLAGRIKYLELTPFALSEVDHFPKLWLRGGFPRSYLARGDKESAEWRTSYIRTFLEQDIPNLGLQVPPRTLQRFWLMLSHYHGGMFNASEIGTSLGVSHTTARHYLDILTATFMIRELRPWHENIGKRQVKMPKIFFRDAGILHSLLNIVTKEQLYNHPKLGASWEGFVLEEVIRSHRATPEEAFFWGVHNQAELDLLIVKEGKRLGFEIKYTDSPKLTPSMRKAAELLHLDQLTVVIPGNANFPLAPGIRAIGVESLLL